MVLVIAVMTGPLSSGRDSPKSTLVLCKEIPETSGLKLSGFNADINVTNNSGAVTAGLPTVIPAINQPCNAKTDQNQGSGHSDCFRAAVFCLFIQT